MPKTKRSKILKCWNYEPIPFHSFIDFIEAMEKEEKKIKIILFIVTKEV